MPQLIQVLSDLSSHALNDPGVKMTPDTLMLGKFYKDENTRLQVEAH